MLFAIYLDRDYASGTTAQYVYDVKVAHYYWLGLRDLKHMEVTFERLALLIRILKARKPAVLRTKAPFTKYHARDLWLAVQARFNAGDWDVVRLWAMVVMAREFMLRLNEIALTEPMSIANRHPITVSDIKFWDHEGHLIAHPGSLADANARIEEVAQFSTRAPPSKADKLGTNEELRSVMPVGLSAHFSSCWALWFFFGCYPVPEHRRSDTPLFRADPTGPNASQSVTTARLMSTLKAVCKAANIGVLECGMHCFRVGGLNDLQDLGCGPAELMALGRWSSDVWTLYSRRSRTRLTQWQAHLANATGELCQ